ncbi:hypothetical protein PIB30_095291 [Stylosanthes scabra]|uniref:Uncharacterized protein n=1 Tax=Stylosanthes scabra TaxID=79078 RepID=A0ABU6XTA5_9FABA|nr:hypothetical protein [Stylosanthes scabra]
MAVIAQGLHGKGNLRFPSTIYKLCKDAGVPLREFRKTSKIPEEKLIIAKQMESTRLPRNVPQQQQDDNDEDEPMPQAGGGNEEDQEAEAEKNLQLAVERQARDISEMRKHLNIWTRNALAREAYSCWAR